MVISQAELNLIMNGRLHRRMMRLPIERGDLGELKKCPVREGRIYRLTAGGGKAMVTVLSVRREKLAALSVGDAKREGYAGVSGALDAWQKRHGRPSPGTEAWVVGFELGDQSGRFDRPVHLARHGDYTLEASQAVKGEPEVLMPLAKDLARARAKALERRAVPQRQLVGRMQKDADRLHGALTDMKLRNRARRIAHDLARLSLELPSCEVVDCDVRPASDEPHMDADSPLPRGVSKTPEAA